MNCEPVNDFLCPRLLQTFYFELHNNVIAKRSTLLLSSPRGEAILQMLLPRNGRDTLSNRDLKSVAVKIKDNLPSYSCFSCHKWAAPMSSSYTWSSEVHHWSGEYFHCSLWQNKWPFSFTNVKKPELLFSICLFKTHFVESFRNFNVEFFNRKINLVTTLQPSCEIMTMANLQI